MPDLSVHSRRDFLATTAVAGLGTLAGSPLWSAPSVSTPIVDTHQHLWDLSRFNLPWTKSPEASVLSRNYLPADYTQATAGLGVVKAVYMEVDVEPAQRAQEADYIIDLCAKGETPTVAAVISGPIGTPEFAPYIRKYAASKYVKGVRRVLHGPSTPAGFCRQDAMIRDIQLLGELGKSFDLCLRAAEIPDAVKVVDLCKETRFIVDHCGNLPVGNTDRKVYDSWKRGMSELAQRDRVVCKISGIVASAKKGAWKPDDLAPTINTCVELFGHDRVMFGGDWPVCTLGASYKEWVTALRQIISSWSVEYQKKLFHDNAVRFYGLS